MVSLIAPALRKIWNNVGGSAGGGGGITGGHNNSNASNSNRPISQSTGFFGSRVNLSWNPEAFRTLYHFVRCSQLEYVGQEGRSPIQVKLICHFNEIDSMKIIVHVYLCPNV